MLCNLFAWLAGSHCGLSRLSSSLAIHTPYRSRSQLVRSCAGTAKKFTEKRNARAEFSARSGCCMLTTSLVFPMGFDAVVVS